MEKGALPADGVPPGLLLSGRRSENESTSVSLFEPFSTSRFPPPLPALQRDFLAHTLEETFSAMATV